MTTTTPEHACVLKWASNFHGPNDKNIATSVEQGSPVQRVQSNELLGLDPEQAMKRMLSAPVVVPDALQGSKALLWTLSFFEHRYSDERVVVNDRAPARRADACQGRLQKSIETSMGEYLTYIQGTGGLPYKGSSSQPIERPPPLYLNGWHAPSQLTEIRDGFPPMPVCAAVDHTLQILQQIDNVLFGKVEPTRTNSTSTWAEQTNRKLNKLFLGPAGTVTRLHYDAQDAHGWLSQLEGSKLFVAFSPEEGKYLYQLEGETHTQQSPLDPLCPDYGAFPSYKHTNPKVAVVQKGECIIIPKGWWHYAVALEPSVTAQRNFYSTDNAASLVKPIVEAARGMKQA